MHQHRNNTYGAYMRAIENTRLGTPRSSRSLWRAEAEAALRSYRVAQHYRKHT